MSTNNSEVLDVVWVADCRDCTWQFSTTIESRAGDRADIHEATHNGHRTQVEPVTPDGSFTSEPPC